MPLLLTLDEEESAAGNGSDTSPALPSVDVSLRAGDAASGCQVHNAHHGEKNSINLVGFTKGSKTLRTILSPE